MQVYLIIISIHALVKRATGWDGADTVNPSISIHALVKRATQAPEKFPNVAVYFNPRPREEGDTSLKRFMG